MSFLGKNRQLLSLLLIVFILTGLASFSARENFAQTFVERWIQFAVAPLQRATSYFVTKWQDLVQLIKDFGSLREENERLKLELENIQYKLNNMIENTLERDRLRNLLQYATAEKALDLVLARVIARDVTAWQSELIIDRGTQHGLNKGDPVVTHLGAVGRVVEVSTTTSKILVITDPRSAVAALIQNGRDGAILEGDPSVPGMCRLARLPREFKVNVGDVVVTSGLGSIFPSGHSFLLGTVTEVVLSSDGLLQTAKVKPSVEFSRLEEVLVLRRKAK